MAGAYDTLRSAADSIAMGTADPFLDQGERQLKNSSNPITQGWSLVANAIGSAITGDNREMNRIGDMADKGEMGVLPKLGSWLGAKVFDLVNWKRK